jgi:hypothetical protein
MGGILPWPDLRGRQQTANNWHPDVEVIDLPVESEPYKAAVTATTPQPLKK